MQFATLEVPTGRELERQLADVEAHIYDEKTRKIILERVAMAKDPNAVFVPHEQAFAALDKKLLELVSRRKDA